MEKLRLLLRRNSIEMKTPPRWQAEPELVVGEAMTPRTVEEIEGL